MVAEHGANGLTLRSLAAAAGTSTSAIYSLFGSKDELYLAVVRQAIASFGSVQAAVPSTEDPLTDLRALAWAYWEWALDNPHLYLVMFSVAMADPKAVRALREEAEATREPLRRCVRAALAAGVLEGPETAVVMSIWAAVHGATTIGLAQRLGRGAPADSLKGLFAATIEMFARGWESRS